MFSIKNIFSVALVAMSLLVTSVNAKELSPYRVLEQVGNKLFTRIANSQQQLQTSPQLMLNIVEDELMPSVDYKYTAYRILGKHLAKISKQQRQSFTDSMRTHLVNTYASALKQYKNQQVIFEKDKPTNGKKIVAIKTQIVALNQPTINIVFKMRQNKKTKEWKAFDMVVEGISLLSTKQAELSRRINSLGVDKVTLELASTHKR